MNESNEEHFVGKIAQKAIVVFEAKVLLMRDPRESDEIWELPGGRMNMGEEPREALARELKEELGVEFDIHEVVHLEQFLQVSDGKQSFMIAYRATMKDSSAEFVLAEDEVCDLQWFNKSEVSELTLFPEYQRALQVFFNE